MKIRFFISVILMFCLFISNANSRPSVKNKKFENPALQFEGTWRVDSYDFREFVEIPADLAIQLKNQSGAFPIGQRLRFELTGPAIISGNIDPATMKYEGPRGEGLNMTILRPFEHELCDSRLWSGLCEMKNKKDYSVDLMIGEIVNWTRGIPHEYVEVWNDVKPLQYTFLHLGKLYNFDTRVAKNGDIFIMVTVEGIVKDRGKNVDTKGGADVGIRLKRISN